MDNNYQDNSSDAGGHARQHSEVALRVRGVQHELDLLLAAAVPDLVHRLLDENQAAG